MIIGFAFAACERPLELDIAETSERLVVIAPFSDEERIAMQISLGRSVEDTVFNFNLRPTVQLYENGNLKDRFEAVFDPELGIPVYRSSIIPSRGVNYEIEVSNAGYETVRSQSYIPGHAPDGVLDIKSIEQFAIAPDSILFTVQAVLFFEDSLGLEEFYHLKLFQKIESYRVLPGGDTIVPLVKTFELSPSIADNDNNMVRSFDGGMLFNDEDFDGNPYSLRFAFSRSIDVSQERLGKLEAELRTTSKDYFLYYTSLSRQLTSQGPPFSEPVILYNNIESGLGFFGGYAVARDSIFVDR